MLKRGKELARAAGEAIGVLAPSLPDATAAAEQRRQTLVEAQAAIASAEVGLQAAHDRGAEISELTRSEAALADATLTAERAQRAYTAAEKRLTAARDAESQRAREGVRGRLDQALKIRESAAAEIDRLVASIAQEVQTIDAQDEIISEASRIGVAARHSGFNPGRGRQSVQMALSQHGVIARTYLGDPTSHPGARDLIGRENGALTAV